MAFRCCAARVGAAPPPLSARVISSRRVAPKTPPYLPTAVTLSPLDVATTPLMIIHLPFFFGGALDAGALEASLATTLDRFPLFAGRLRKNKNPDKNHGPLEVLLSGAGALFEVAESPNGVADVAPALGAASRFEPRDVSPFYPGGPDTALGLIDAPAQPLLRVRLTRLADGGCCLAVAVPHLVADLTAAKELISSWAAAYAATGAAPPGGWEDATPVRYGREALAPYAERLPEGYSSPVFEPWGIGALAAYVGGSLWHISLGGGVADVAFHVSARRLTALKARATAAIADGGDVAAAAAAAGVRWISTNDALVARVWQVLSRLPAKGAAPTLRLSVDMRSRLCPPLGGAVVGNILNTVALHAADARVATLPALAVRVRAAVNGVDAELPAYGRELAYLGAAAGARGAQPFPVTYTGGASMLRPDGDVVISNWAWDAQYKDAAFGAAGAPVWLQPPKPRGPNAVFILPAPGGGACVFMSLNKVVADQLRATCAAL